MPTDLPEHVAIIMDGNGRWATARSLPRTEGHRAGSESVRAVVTEARRLGIPYLTLYAFSSQNWSRPEDEVEQLMSLLVEFCQSEEQLMLDKGIRLRVIGERSQLPQHARQAIEAVESSTADNSEMTLIIAVSYGSREELLRAVRAIASDVEAGVLSAAEVDQASIESRLWTAGVPDPDLVIRTSGELRVSNFLLWQIAYAELYVLDKLWPDFREPDFNKALASFGRRERRFGGIAPSGLDD